VLAAATIAVYANSLGGAFVFDDITSLLAENPTIRHLWPLFGPDGVLNPPPGGLTVSGRPLANLSFALNYAAGRLDPAGYHVVNLAIHAAAALVLFGLVRRTLGRWRAVGATDRSRPAVSDAALPAWTVALLWALHPLQTESVTYVVQRTESLAGLFALLTFYGFARAADDAEAPAAGFRIPKWGWKTLAVAACLAAMATKETAAAVPLLVLVYDATFISAGYREAWRARRGTYLALAATWVLLAVLVVLNRDRAGTAGFDAAVSPWRYAVTQCQAIGRYVQLAVWPHPLVIDRGYALVPRLALVWPQALLIILALVATGWAVVRRSPLGFAGAWFFALLAPSSSFVPVATQTVAEHRMYLPLAALVAVVVLAAWRRFGRIVFPVACAVAVVGGAATVLRNGDYASAVDLWRLTTTQAPANWRAENNLGFHLFLDEQPAAALPHFEAAQRLAPENRQVHFNIARTLVRLRRLPEAVPYFEEAIRRNPTKPAMMCEYAESLGWFGRLADALPWYQRALALAPSSPAVENSLGLTLARNGRLADAVPHFQVALRVQPDFPEAEANLGDTLVALGRPAEAAEAYQRSLNLAPSFAAHSGLAKILVANSRTLDAAEHFAEAVALRPDSAEARVDLGLAYVVISRDADAAPEFDEALRLDPLNARAHTQLGLLLIRDGQPKEALLHFETAVQLQPSDPAACRNLGRVLSLLGRYSEAVACDTQAVNLAPSAPAHTDLADALARSGRYDEAAAHYEAALQLDRNYAPATAHLAELRRAVAASARSPR